MFNLVQAWPSIPLNDPLNVDMNFIGFREAVCKGLMDRVRAILCAGTVDPAVLDNWAIRRACDSNEWELAVLLLGDARVDPAGASNSCIMHSAHKGTVAIMDLLLKDGRADPCADDHRPIRLAAMCGHAGIVALLLKDGRTDPAAQENAALYEAASNGLDDVVEVLLAERTVIAGAGVAEAHQAAIGAIPAFPRHPSTALLFEGVYDPAAFPPSVASLSLSGDEKARAIYRRMLEMRTKESERRYRDRQDIEFSELAEKLSEQRRVPVTPFQLRMISELKSGERDAASPNITVTRDMFPEKFEGIFGAFG
jgi:hypothetical protein